MMCIAERDEKEKKGQLNVKKILLWQCDNFNEQKRAEREKYKFNELDNFETCIN